MPEKMTKQEAKIEQTIRALRITKELLEQDINVLPYCLGEKDGLGETVKVKKPKADKADKITNETQDKEGFGLAGEDYGKEITKEIKEIVKAIDQAGVGELDNSIKALMQKVHAMNHPTRADIETIHHELEKLKMVIRRYDKMDSFVG
jgi:hypothetical protein